jgi:putative phosphoribosyl transferase
VRKLVSIPTDHASLEGELVLPEGKASIVLPEGKASIVLFAHGSGSSRFSPRNNYVASILQQAGIGTLLFDLLTREEDANYETRFDIDLLTRRLLAATAWIKREPSTQTLNIGYFGASTGAAAALQAASEMDREISAVVSRGGRPDLAGPTALSKVQSPTLLIVGGYDDVVIMLNRDAFGQLNCEKELTIIPGATHLFEEPGTLEQAAQAATAWFMDHLTEPPAVPSPAHR